MFTQKQKWVTRFNVHMNATCKINFGGTGVRVVTPRFSVGPASFGLVSPDDVIRIQQNKSSPVREAAWCLLSSLLPA